MHTCSTNCYQYHLKFEDRRFLAKWDLVLKCRNHCIEHDRSKFFYITHYHLVCIYRHMNMTVHVMLPPSYNKSRGVTQYGTLVRIHVPKNDEKGRVLSQIGGGSRDLQKGGIFAKKGRC